VHVSHYQQDAMDGVIVMTAATKLTAVSLYKLYSSLKRISMIFKYEDTNLKYEHKGRAQVFTFN